MTQYHYHEELTQVDVENMRVYQMKIVYTEQYLEYADDAKTNIHYYAAPNGQILIDLADALINHSLDIESIEITRV